MIDRNVEFPNRFRMTKVDGTDDIYDIIPAPGEVIAPGDTFNKANMLPDSITAMLGLKMSNPQVADALNVLANVGNLHVWERVQTYSEDVPAGYTLGPETNTKLCYMYYTEGMSVSYASSVSIDDAGNVFLVSPASISLNTPGDTLVNEVAITKGKFVKFTATNSSNIATPGVYFIPTDATFTYVTSGTSANQGLYCDKAQKVNPYPITPAGTTTDYLTSTDRNAYPDQSAEGGQDAYYTLGDVVSGYLFASAWDGNASNYYYSETIKVSDTGTLTQENVKRYTANATNDSWVSNIQSAIRGKFITVSGETNNGGSKGTNLVYIPADAIVSYFENGVSLGYPYNYGFLVNKMQPVTGHAAIPANTTITYLGQLGGGARIEVGSYVGTGTQGSANPTSLTFNFVPKMVIVTKQGQYGFALDGTFSSYSLFWIPGITYFNPGGSGSSSYADAQKNKITLYGKTLSWYRDSTSSNGSASHQLNSSGETYQWIALG